MDFNRRTRLLAASLTLLLCVAMVTVMMLLTLKRADSSERRWPPVDSSELLLDGEYVMRGDIPEPDHNEAQSAQSEAPDNGGEDMEDQGEPNNAPSPLLTSTQESPMKEKPKPQPEKPGPTKEEMALKEKEKRENEAREQISSRVKFGGTGTSSGSAGKSGSPNGNASQGALSGAPGTSLKGRTLESWARPTGRATGTIVISVRVNRQGNVISAVYRSGSGAVASLKAARSSCENAARNSRFSVALDGPAEQSGTITYRFD